MRKRGVVGGDGNGAGGCCSVGSFEERKFVCCEAIMVSCPTVALALRLWKLMIGSNLSLLNSKEYHPICSGHRQRKAVCVTD